jgi:hypothetical protein
MPSFVCHLTRTKNNEIVPRRVEGNIGLAFTFWVSCDFAGDLLR